MAPMPILADHHWIQEKFKIISFSNESIVIYSDFIVMWNQHHLIMQVGPWIVILFGVAESIQIKQNGNTTKGHSRNPRALVFPSSSAIGIFTALAIPLNLPNRNVFLSYNFEANYNMPYLGSDILPGVDQRFEFDFEEEAAQGAETGTETIGRTLNGDNKSTTEAPKGKRNKKKMKKNKKRPSKSYSRRSPLEDLITRKSVYNALEVKFKNAGYKGKPCLLRMICEVNAEKIGCYNGVFGDIIHFIFTPTTSDDENISEDYYIAEYDGIMSECSMYHEKCPKSLLDLISKEYITIW